MSATPSAAVARILEHSGDVSVHRKGQAVQTQSWVELSDGDTVQIPSAASVRIAFASGEVVEKSGAALIIIDVRQPGQGCSVLGALSLAARALILGTTGQSGERPMAVRSGQVPEANPMSVPLLLYPYDGELVTATPITFAWRPITGVDRYQFSLYDTKGMFWQSITPGSRLEYVSDGVHVLEPGEDYRWRVEAFLGDSHLTSLSSSFTVSAPGVVDSVEAGIAEICSHATDATSAALLAAEFYFSMRLYARALQSLTEDSRGTETLPLIRKRAEYLVRLKDGAALETLMPDLLGAMSVLGR